MICPKFNLYINFLVPSPCEKLKCHVYARCVNGQTVTCQCPVKSECATTPQSICGSNGQTYDSICAMQAESCERNVVVTLVNPAKCGKKTSCFVLMKRITRNSSSTAPSHPRDISYPNFTTLMIKQYFIWVAVSYKLASTE